MEKQRAGGRLFSVRCEPARIVSEVTPGRGKPLWKLTLEAGNWILGRKKRPFWEGEYVYDAERVSSLQIVDFTGRDRYPHEAAK